jgi:hypothetical protein
LIKKPVMSWLHHSAFAGTSSHIQPKSSSRITSNR